MDYVQYIAMYLLAAETVFKIQQYHTYYVTILTGTLVDAKCKILKDVV